jgi:hypothetical protein
MVKLGSRARSSSYTRSSSRQGSIKGYKMTVRNATKVSLVTGASDCCPVLDI